MTFELTINRVGAFAGTTPGTGLVKPERLEGLFRRQLDGVRKSRRFAKDLWREIAACADNFQQHETVEDAESRQIRVRKMLVPTARKGDPDWTLVGTLPDRKFRCTVTSKSGKARDWIVRVRVSITACALQGGKKNTKLWTTFEGVPASDDPSDRPSADDVAAFIAVTDKMADAAVDPLYEAYQAALEKTKSVDLSDFFLRKNRIRIRMSDSNDYSVEALLDAVYYEKLDVSEIRAAPGLTHAKRGLEIFEKFVSDVTNGDAHIPDHSLSLEVNDHLPLGVNSHFDGFKGIFFRVAVGKKEVIVAGLGQQSGAVSGLESAVAPEKRRFQKQEGTLRAMSASRPISALIADTEAAQVELAM